MTKTPWLAVGVLAAWLVAVPAPAHADDPQVTTHRDGSVSYVDPALADRETSTFVGTLRPVVRDDFTTGTATYLDPVLVTESGDTIPVDLDGELLNAGPITAKLVEGPALDSALAGRSSAPVAVAQAKVASAAAATPSSHRVYLAVVTNKGSVRSTASIEAAVDQGIAWWKAEAGPGVESFVRAGGTKKLSISASQCGFANPGQTWVQAAQKFPSVSFAPGDGNHLVVVTSKSCNHLGVGTVGEGLSDGGGVLMADVPNVFAATFAHEIGHNLSLDHANRDCASCEYENLYSVMGFAISFNNQALSIPALDTAYRAQLGLTGPAEVRTVQAGRSATVELTGRGAPAGVRGIAVRSTSGQTYWVDYRAGTGRDAGSFYQRAGATTTIVPGVLYPSGVTIERQVTDPMQQPIDARSTWLAEKSTGSSSLARFTTGDTMTAGDVTIRVDEITAAGAKVTINPGLPPAATDPVAAGQPTISGTVRVGQRLTAAPGAWAGGTGFGYQWLADGTAITGAVASSYVLTAADRGRAISVNVTGYHDDYLPVTIASAETAAVLSGTLTAPTPKISGTSKVGKKLTAKPGTWTSGTKLTYRWKANGKSISGATKSTYKIAKKYKGKKITVTVTGSKSGYTTVSKTSKSTSKVKKK